MNTEKKDQKVGARFEKHSLEAIIPVFEQLARAYREKWGVTVLLADHAGSCIFGTPECAKEHAATRKCAATRRQAIEESVRWGEPSIVLCPDGHMLWAVPLMHNAVVYGGLIAVLPDSDATGKAFPPIDVHNASMDLLSKAEAANLTNAALLHLQRQEARRESARAEAIHALKDHDYHSLRDIYLVEEPALISAVKRGDRHEAREVINRVLVGIYFRGRERPLLLKSFLLELVVMLSRTAVEAGADPAEMLGSNYSAFTDLATIEGEEELTAWLVAMLERIMDAISSHHRYPVSVLLDEAIRYMREHAHEDISRDDAARVACLSPTHFSRVVKQTFGYSFTELLARMRVDKARELLELTEKSLVQVSLECGFTDQSYFTKVFQKYTGETPGEYRRKRSSTL